VIFWTIEANDNELVEGTWQQAATNLMATRPHL